MRKSTVTLELIPGLASAPDEAATITLFQAWRRLAGWYTCQIQAGKAGSRFLVTAPESKVTSLKHLLTAYCPELNLKTVRTPMTSSLRCFHWRPKKLFKGAATSNSNPLAYLTTAASNLGRNQTVVYRLDFKARRWPLIASGQRWLRAGRRLIAEAKAEQPLVQEPTPAASEFKLKTRLLLSESCLGRQASLVGSLNLLSDHQSGWKIRRLVWRRTWSADSRQLAKLFHLPEPSGNPDDLSKSLHKTLPLSPGLKAIKRPSCLHLGKTNHRQRQVAIYLSKSQRRHHVYIIGGTGTGKTTMLKHHIIQDIQANKRVIVLDPHGDLATDLLHYVPQERQSDVIYFDPADLQNNLGLNLLEVDPHLTGDDRLLAADLVTESTVAILRKIFSAEGEGGHRIEYILRNTIQTALSLPDPTLFTIFRLLTDAGFRWHVIKKLDNPDLQRFWQQEISQAGNYQRVKLTFGVTSKIGRFLFCVPAKRVFERNQGLDFERILSERRIFICNLAKGRLGDDTARLFGATILGKIQLAVLRRAQINPDNRPANYLYVDEFQDFASNSFVEMLSEARKYGLHLTLAQQSSQQQTNPRLNEIILANVGTVIAFRSGSPQDAKLILPLFEPYLGWSDLINLPAHNFYAKLGAIKPQPPVSGITKLPPKKIDKEQVAEIKELSREYGSDDLMLDC